MEFSRRIWSKFFNDVQIETILKQKPLNFWENFLKSFENLFFLKLGEIKKKEKFRNFVDENVIKVNHHESNKILK